MPTEKHAELKGCPFCGGIPFRSPVPETLAEEIRYSIMCGRGSCMAEGSQQDTEESAIVAWNTRAALAVGGEEFDALIRTHNVESEPWDIRYVSVEDARKLYAELAATRAGKKG